jgi:protein-tyrosine phosphatase
MYGNPMPFGLNDPTNGSLVDLLKQAGEQAGQNQNILIHCSAGLGRMALILTLLVRYVLGLSGAEAIEWLGQHQPGARPRPAQMYGGG